MNKKTIKDINLAGKRVLVRVDYNVTLKGNRVADDYRLRQSLPTIKYLLGQGCLVILASHLGRPEGKVKKEFSLRPVAKTLQKILARKVQFVTDYLSSAGQEKLKQLKTGVVLLENLRFHPGEEANSPKFAQQLAKLADVFVNDGFGVAHRVQASVVGVTKYLPAVAGLLLAKEVELISQIINKPQPPLVAILGGAKTETKIHLIGKLLEISESVLLGGCLANTFLEARGYNLGKSVVDEQAVVKARQLWQQAKQKQIIPPVDVVLGNLKTGQVDGVVGIQEVGPDWQILDIGPQTGQKYSQLIGKAKTIIWNGPMGVVEKKQFRQGTEAVYQAIAKNKQAVSLVGGGDTLAALTQEEHLKGITHFSTGGGAMLEFIEKGRLPGIESLLDK